MELHKLWGQFQANLNLGWCLSLCNSSRSVISLPVLLNVSSHRHWLDWLDVFDTSSCLLKFNLICFIIVLIDLYYCILLFCIICKTWLLQILMRVLQYSLERNIAYFNDTLLQIQCHNYNWEYEKGSKGGLQVCSLCDLKRILKCAVFLKENRILILTEELDLPSRFELHENLRRFIDTGLECRHFHGNFTISHVVTTLT